MLLRPKLRLFNFKKGRLALARVRKGKRVRFGPKAEIKAAFCNTGVVEVCATAREVGVVRPETWLGKWAVAPKKQAVAPQEGTAAKGSPVLPKGSNFVLGFFTSQARAFCFP